MKNEATPDVLNLPIHAVILRPNHVQDLQRRGKFPGGVVVKQAPLPQEYSRKKEKKGPSSLAKLSIPKAPQLVKQVAKKVRLNVMHSLVPELSAELKPPCGDCRTAACCSVFVVDITELEYESGYYDPYAIKLEPKYMRQLKSSVLLMATAASPVHLVTDKDVYYLEGMVGEPCPFLQANKCSIYANRPLVCRIYSCVGDDRITQEHRDGTSGDYYD